MKLLLPDDAFPDVRIYLEQADHLEVVGKCGCGCPSLMLDIDASRARQANFHGDPLLPIEAEAGEGDNFVQLILFAPTGWLEYLELVCHGEVMTSFPAVAELRLVNRWRGADTTG